jgi:capsular exopolysaccharide synthesis family protein
MVTGPVKGVGKTSTSINLAINIARLQNKTALLVDLDLRHPSVHQYLGIKPVSGIGDVLTGNAKLEDAILNTGINDFFLLPGKKKYEYSSELLSSDVMHNLLTTIKHLDENTVIIFDMPPVLGCDDVPAISPYIDACLMIIEEGATKLNELDEAVNRIKDTNIIGYVLNKSADSAAAKYYY